MKAGIGVGFLAMTIWAAVPAQQSMPPGYVDYITDDLKWHFVNEPGGLRVGTVFSDAGEMAPIMIACSGGQGSIYFSLPRRVDPAQIDMLRFSVKGRALDIPVGKSGSETVNGTFDLARMASVAEGSTEKDVVEVAAGRWKMGYTARQFAAAYAAFRQACSSRRP